MKKREQRKEYILGGGKSINKTNPCIRDRV